MRAQRTRNALVESKCHVGLSFHILKEVARKEGPCLVYRILENSNTLTVNYLYYKELK